MSVNNPTQLATLAFVFPGQGSQSLGMLAELAKSHDQVRSVFERASEVLEFDLWELVQSGPERELNRTQNTQPAMLCAGVALWRIWRDHGGPLPVRMAGHSLGEYTALVCAGAIEFADAVALVAERGRRMQEAVPDGSGAMAAVLGLEDAQVEEICRAAEQGEVVSAVNYNSPGQIVVAGHKTAVERAVEIAKASGAKRALMLPVSVPSHCALMQPAAEQFKPSLERLAIAPPTIPVIHNTDALIHDDPDEIRAALALQLYRPVRWVETVRVLADQDVETLVECGPGKVLTGLTKRIDRRVKAVPLFDPRSLQAALEQTGIGESA